MPSKIESAPHDREVLGTVREVFLERLVPGRECGECVACCKLLEINKPELNKPADVLCPHNTGRGCGIYATRPIVCRNWFCLWRRIGELPEFTRPDKIGIVFAVDRHDPARTPFEKFYIVARALNGWGNFEQPKAAAAVKMFIDEGSLPVWLSFGGNKMLLYPDKELADAIVNPANAAEHLKSQARIWRKRLELE